MENHPMRKNTEIQNTKAKQYELLYVQK